MIFVTVGTHEQPFDRLVKAVDDLKMGGTIGDDVFIQTGFSTYEPRCCQWKRLLPCDQMWQKVREARIVITHGGPASFMMPLQIGKIPIVVPRQEKFHEHVNDHQVNFIRQVAGKIGIIPVMDADELANTVANYEAIAAGMGTLCRENNTRFNMELQCIIDGLL